MRKSPLLISILAALSGCQSSHADKACLELAPERACPPADKVEPKQLSLPGQCGDDLEITEVVSGGTRETITADDGSEHPSCCYTVEVVDHDPQGACVVGRPYYEANQARRAPLRAEGSSPDAPCERATAWARAGADEHASVAAFTRLALQLLAHGAPSDLLRPVHQAALDEIDHAELCWSLARRFGAAVVAAGAFPFTQPVAVDVTLAELASDAVREGCLGETLGAHLAAIAAELAPEPGVKAALQAIAVEEAAHAVLSYRIVAWALCTGGSTVKAAVQAAFAAPWPKADVAELALRANVPVALLSAAATQGVAQILEPARDSLLAVA